MRQRFHGAIAGIGSTSGVRVVVARWDASGIDPQAPGRPPGTRLL